MESLALFIAKDDNFEKMNGDNYRIMKLFAIGDLFSELETYSLILFKEKIIGDLKMIYGLEKLGENVKFKINLIIKPFYKDFNKFSLRGLIECLHLNHSTGLEIPDLDIDEQKVIEIVFTGNSSVERFKSKIVRDDSGIVWDMPFFKNEFFDNYIEENENRSILAASFYRPSYKFEDFFQLETSSISYTSFIDLFSNRDLASKFMKCFIIGQVLCTPDFSRTPLLDHDDGHVGKFICELESTYLEYFGFRYDISKSEISEEEFVKRFYDWEHNPSWINKNVKNDDLLKILTWADEYIDDERKRLLKF